MVSLDTYWMQQEFPARWPGLGLSSGLLLGLPPKTNEHGHSTLPLGHPIPVPQPRVGWEVGDGNQPWLFLKLRQEVAGAAWGR